MKEKPIIFSTPMVQALLNTKPNTWPAEPIDTSKPCKWQTRRIVKPQPREIGKGERLIIEAGKLKIVWRGIGELWETKNIRNVPYNIGDVLWVRETWKTIAYSNESGYEICVKYRADNTESNWIDLDDEELWERIVNQEEAWRKHHVNETKWRPSIFMPHEASRLFLEVKNVRLERVQDITDEDARMEGVVKGHADNGNWYIDYKSAYAFLWNHLNAKRGYPWGKNPWVWVYEFMRVKS